jgi:ribosomal protein S12 methylthiotransferase accessory factor
MDMIIDFPGGSRVDAHFESLTVRTDQPVQAGGDRSAPTPFEIFLAALGTCAGIYVLGFCRQRNLPTEGIRLVQSVRMNPKTKLAEKIELDIQLPAEFPEKYQGAVIRAAEQCKVKKQFEYPPEVEVKTSVPNSGGSSL